jgi:hypothetical protein
MNLLSEVVYGRGNIRTVNEDAGFIKDTIEFATIELNNGAPCTAV